MDKLLSLTNQLIAIPSVTSTKPALRQIIALVKKYFSSLTVESFEKDGFPSLLIYKQKTRPKKFKIILNAHLDVVEGTKDQFMPVIKNGRLYARGAADMKAAAAAEILVFKEVVKQVNYPLALQLVTDEETNGWRGTKYQLEQGIRSEFVIAGEPTDLNIGYCAKGIIWLKISCQGKAAHGAYLWLGDNAIWKMHQFLTKIKQRYKMPSRAVWKTTINLSQIITTNTTLNRVPSDCQAYFDLRYIPQDKDTVLKKFLALLPSNFSYEILVNEPSHYTDPNNCYLKILSQTIKQVIGKTPQKLARNGGSDIRHYAPFNCPGVEFGISGANWHSHNEYAQITSLEQYYSILKKFLLSI
jgi:succinyl-diaminopimelate desuccinylase